MARSFQYSRGFRAPALFAAHPLPDEKPPASSGTRLAPVRIHSQYFPLALHPARAGSANLSPPPVSMAVARSLLSPSSANQRVAQPRLLSSTLPAGERANLAHHLLRYESHLRVHYHLLTRQPQNQLATPRRGSIHPGEGQATSRTHRLEQRQYQQGSHPVRTREVHS